MFCYLGEGIIGAARAWALGFGFRDSGFRV